MQGQTVDMGPEWPYAMAALLIVALGVLWVYLRYERPRRRQDAERARDVAEIATRNGWRYDASAPQTVAELAYPPFDRATIKGHRVRRLASGTSRGLQFRAFDLEHDRHQGQGEETYRYAVLAVALPDRATSISVAPAALQLDADRRESRLARREPFLEVTHEHRPDIRTVTASRDFADAVAGPVIEVLDDAPGVGWSVDGDAMVLIRGGPADRRARPRHWIEDLDEGLATLLRIDRELPEPQLGTPPS